MFAECSFELRRKLQCISSVQRAPLCSSLLLPAARGPPLVLGHAPLCAQRQITIPTPSTHLRADVVGHSAVRRPARSGIAMI